MHVNARAEALLDYQEIHSDSQGSPPGDWLQGEFKERGMKVFITKYALTKGIIEAEAEHLGDGMARVGRSYYHGKDWHKTRRDAIIDARDRRTRKIASLEKQLKRVKGLSFV